MQACPMHPVLYERRWAICANIRLTCVHVSTCRRCQKSAAATIWCTMLESARKSTRLMLPVTPGVWSYWWIINKSIWKCRLSSWKCYSVRQTNVFQLDKKPWRVEYIYNKSAQIGGHWEYECDQLVSTKDWRMTVIGIRYVCMIEQVWCCWQWYEEKRGKGWNMNEGEWIFREAYWIKINTIDTVIYSRCKLECILWNEASC